MCSWPFRILGHEEGLSPPIYVRYVDVVENGRNE